MTTSLCGAMGPALNPSAAAAIAAPTTLTNGGGPELQKLGEGPPQKGGGPIGPLPSAVAGVTGGAATVSGGTAPGTLTLPGSVAGANGGAAAIGGGNVTDVLTQLTQVIQRLRDSLTIGGGATAPIGLPPMKGGVVPGGLPPSKVGSPIQVAPGTPIQGGGPVASASPVHTSIHGTVLNATASSLTLRDDTGATRTYQIKPEELAKMDLPHLLEKHVATGKTLDLVFSDEAGTLYAHGYSHPPAVPVPGAPPAAPAAPGAVSHTALHGTVVSATTTAITLRDDAGALQQFAIRPEDLPALDMAHLLQKHVPSGKTLNLVFADVNGVKYATSYNHPA